MNKKKNIFQNLGFIAIFLAIICILSIFFMYHIAIGAVIEERDEQLFSLAHSVDTNLDLKLKNLLSDLDYTLKNAEYVKLEDNLKEDGNKMLITYYFLTSHLFESSSLEGIVVFDDHNNQIYTLNQNNHSSNYQYTFLEDTVHDDITVCYDQYGKYSVALENHPRNNAYTYYLLVDLNHFYDEIVPEKLHRSNWIVFYEPECNFLLQNHDNQDYWMILSEKEIQNRHDGYSILLKNQLANTLGAETYHYENYDMKVVPERIVSLPQKMTTNGHFAISIASDSDALYSSIRQSRATLLFFMVILLFCGMFTTYMLLSYRHNAIEAEGILEMQKREASLMEEQMKSSELEKTLLEAQVKENELEKTLLEAQVKENELEKTLLEAQQQNSIHQLQPHFLYNSLSSIREIVMESPEYAADLLLNFTIYLRSCLKAFSAKELIPFEQELQNTQAYVAIEMMRFGENKLTIEYDIQKKDFLIIPLGLQPLVENAIRHGIGKKRYKTGTVRVRTCWEDDFLCIFVEDDGVGFDVEKVRREVENGERDSTGLFNLKMRYKHKMYADMRVESEVGVGSRVCIRIPGGEVLSGDRH